MTTPDPLRRHRRGRIAGAFGGSLLTVAAILTAGTGVAAAATAAEILTAACTHYEPIPDPVRMKLSDCHGANLAGANLTRVNLIGANLSGADLTNTNLTSANLSSAELAGANLTDANLTSTKLYGANWTDANLTNTNLTSATLPYAYLRLADLTTTTLKNTDLEGANLTDANLTGADLTGTKLTDAKLTNAKLTGANLTAANLTRANLIRANLTRANLYDANLTRANLTRANLTSANLDGANLSYANLTSANLYGANLAYANLTGTDLTGANLTGENLTGEAPAFLDITTSYRARFCSEAKDGNTIAVHVNEGQPGDYGDREPEDTWHGQWMSNVTFDTWVGDFSFPTGMGMWCHTVVRTDLREGDWVRLSTWNPTASMSEGLIEVVEVNGAVTERDVSGGWAAATERCCAAGFTTIRAPRIPDPVALTGTAGTSLTRTFTATGTPAPTVTVVDPAKLPPGTTFANDPGTGVPTLSGTPTVAGKYDFTLTAANGVGTPKTLGVTVTVVPIPVAPVFADTAPVALTGAVGTSLTRTFTATGTPAPAVTVVDPAKLPPGTTFANDPGTGVPTLSGTPTTAGKFDFMVTATNGTTPNATLQVTVNVTAAPVIDPPATGSLGSLFGS